MEQESMDVRAAPDDVLAVFGDVAGVPRWSTRTLQTEVLERDDQGRPSLSRFIVDATVKRLAYTLRYRYEPGGVLWEMVEGNMRHNSGALRVVPHGDETRVVYSYEQNPALRLPAVIVRQGMRLGATQLLADLRSELGRRGARS